MKGRTVPAYCAVPIPDTTCVWLARLKIKVGRNPKGLWNATVPVEFTCTVGLVITNAAVIDVVGVVVGVPVGMPVPPVGGAAAGGCCVRLREPVQSEFTVYVPVYWSVVRGVVTPVVVPSNILPVPSKRILARKAVATLEELNPVPSREYGPVRVATEQVWFAAMRTSRRLALVVGLVGVVPVVPVLLVGGVNWEVSRRSISVPPPVRIPVKETAAGRGVEVEKASFNEIVMVQSPLTV